MGNEFKYPAKFQLVDESELRIINSKMDDELDYDYVLYIDEAGDDGLSKVKPIDENGASEWLVISAVLMRSNYEDECPNWLGDIRTDINALQARTLHYRNLTPTKQKRAAELLAVLPIRIFTVCSNKKNMRGYKNPRAETAGGKQFFYNWVVRILMERVTTYCSQRSLKEGRAPGKIKVVFSLRGGHSYGQTKAYWELLRRQDMAGGLYLTRRQIDFRTLSFRLVDYVPHYLEAGLQLADIAASAFYQAVETGGRKWSLEPAKNLEPRVTKGANKKAADAGLVLQPHRIDSIGLNKDQKAIFSHFGYEFRD